MIDAGKSLAAKDVEMNFRIIKIVGGESFKSDPGIGPSFSDGGP